MILLCSWNLGSDGEFFSKLDETEQRRFFEESYNFFKNRYGEENIISAIVHLDEKTPHMPFCHVPVTKDGRLSCKSLFNRNELRELQTDYAKYMQDCGFDIQRGNTTEEKRKHMKENDYKIYKSQLELEKIEQEKEAGLKELKEINSIINQIKKLNNTLEDTLKDIRVDAGIELDLNKVITKKAIIGNGIIVDKNDYSKIFKMAELYKTNKDKLYNIDILLKNIKL